MTRDGRIIFPSNHRVDESSVGSSSSIDSTPASIGVAGVSSIISTPVRDSRATGEICVGASICANPGSVPRSLVQIAEVTTIASRQSQSVNSAPTTRPVRSGVRVFLFVWNRVFKSEPRSYLRLDKQSDCSTCGSFRSGPCVALIKSDQITHLARSGHPVLWKQSVSRIQCVCLESARCFAIGLSRCRYNQKSVI